MAKKKEETKATVARTIENRRARHDYAFLQEEEAGIALVGSEVKSIFLGRAHLTDAYCLIRGGEMWLLNMDVEPYDKATVFQHERRRDRKLLLHRKQIDLLDRRSMEKGLAIVPLKMYFNHGKVKVLIGLGRGKAEYDKRKQIAKDDARREVERARSGRD